jgi:hypothetical protein
MVAYDALRCTKVSCPVGVATQRFGFMQVLFGVQ